ncbi:hypothetical protein QR721_03075 [Aciduricibacillus chroicocephali]|uniref:Integrase SAM-like N-terminal domain-containing protein n=1 Tax=Aciduricibacillus chroicocephali TaxID=3054939 RepID=A0ABY9KWH5_9BACI|nr:hypothetical protein QR721_03075 [Bacillaceae bacterium 44XB]
MNFKDYLLARHEIKEGAKRMKAVSAQQYENRLENLRKKKIYNEETYISKHIVRLINRTYANKTHEYERTLRYYIEYKKYSGQAREYLLYPEFRH